MSRSPDCVQGKHTSCIGDAWDQIADVLTTCACSCHEPRGHRVKPTIDRWGIHLAYFCDLPLDASCHATCDMGCEEWGSPYRKDGVWVHELTDDVEHTYEHTMTTSDDCNIVTWLEEGDEEYAGPAAELRSGLIVPEWISGGGYVWRYPE